MAAVDSVRRAWPAIRGGNRQDNRQRGNAAQLLEKYKSLARDAQLAGDRVQTEYYLQYADHYFRVLEDSRSRFEQQEAQRRPRRDDEEYEADGDEEMTAESEFGRGRTARPKSASSRAATANAAAASASNAATGADRGDRAGCAPTARARGAATRRRRGEERIALGVLPPVDRRERWRSRGGGSQAAPPRPQAARRGRWRRDRASGLNVARIRKIRAAGAIRRPFCCPKASAVTVTKRVTMTVTIASSAHA